jgi:PAS domain S-box-containing protein
MAGSQDLEGYLAAGIRAAQSLPLISRSAALLGMVTTYWREPHELSATEVRSLDVLARLAADFIERLRVEEARWENQQRLASIYDTVRDVIFHVAVEPEGEFRFVSVNAAFLRVTGLTQEMVVGKTVKEVIPEPSLTMVLGKYWQAIEENTTVLWEETSDYPTGRLTGEVSVAPVFDNKGTCTHLVGSVHDITERKQAEAALRQSEERLRRAERLAHMGHWDWDIKTSRVHCSEEISRILGQPEGFTPGFPRSVKIIVPQDRERTKQWVRDCLALKKGSSLELQVTRRNGDLRTLNLISEMLLDEEGRPARLFGSCQDVTESRRAQDEASARQRLESVGTLAGGIAHDFNNLLGAMVAQAELALAELAAGSSPEGELGAIRDVAMRGSEIVRELMIYAGKEAEVRGLVDVSQVVEQMLELLKVSVSKHATLKTNLGDHLPVRATAAQISQLVMNLATNASEAIGDRDGMILVTTRRVTVGHGSREIERLAEGEYVQLEVSDSGCGMSPETRSKVFDPFFSTKSGGRGLGLAVVHGIVRSLGGAINLASEPGHGTTLQILLPCAESTSGAMRGTMSEIGQPARTSQADTVLIVEDEDPLRGAVSKMLDRHGFSVIEARDGSAALDAIREQNNPIHVLFLDITLPGASGREVLQEARRLRPAMRVIVTSAYTQEMAGASLQSTIEHFIRKPYRLDDLVRLIRPNPS